MYLQLRSIDLLLPKKRLMRAKQLLHSRATLSLTIVGRILKLSLNLVSMFNKPCFFLGLGGLCPDTDGCSFFINLANSVSSSSVPGRSFIWL